MWQSLATRVKDCLKVSLFLKYKCRNFVKMIEIKSFKLYIAMIAETFYII